MPVYFLSCNFCYSFCEDLKKIMNTYGQTFHFPDLDALSLFAFEFGALLRPFDVVALEGDLGAGKTTFVQLALKAMELPISSVVTSPTFAYHQTYQGKYKVHHMDWYRIESERKLIELDLISSLEDDAISMIEWFSKYPHVWHFEKITVKLSRVQNQKMSRTVEVVSKGDRPIAICKRLEKFL